MQCFSCPGAFAATTSRLPITNHTEPSGASLKVDAPTRVIFLSSYRPWRCERQAGPRAGNSFLLGYSAYWCSVPATCGGAFDGGSGSKSPRRRMRSPSHTRPLNLTNQTRVK